jgi:predicted pyridoxine 5'-phosphate oxidase superfamily flavin-nucleotide-binding protein
MRTDDKTDAPSDAPTGRSHVHPGERRLQQRVGLQRSDWGTAGTTADIPPVAAQFLASQRLVAVSAVDDAGRLWASVLSGPAGFIEATGATVVRSRSAPSSADPLHGALRSERPLGMLAIEPATRKRMRINGRARIDGGDLVLSTDQVYANCPKYIAAREPHDLSLTVAPQPEAIRTDELTPEQLAWIDQADTFFIGTIAEPFGADASHRGGAPGFVRSAPTRLTWPEYQGNSMYMTLGNLELDARCALVFVDWQHGHTLHLTGRATSDWDPQRAATFPDALQVVDFDIEQVVEVRHHLPVTWSAGQLWRRTPPAADRSAR